MDKNTNINIQIYRAIQSICIPVFDCEIEHVDIEPNDYIIIIEDIVYIKLKGKKVIANEFIATTLSKKFFRINDKIFKYESTK